MTRYFVDGDGRYLGGYEGPEKDLPARFEGAAEVPGAPVHAALIWDGAAWSGAVPAETPDEIAVLKAVLADKGAVTEAEIEAKREQLKRSGARRAV